MIANMQKFVAVVGNKTLFYLLIYLVLYFHSRDILVSVVFLGIGWYLEWGLSNLSW